MLQPPEYFEAVRQNAEKRWEQWSQDSQSRGPVLELFEQLQLETQVVSELLQNADDAGATEASVQIIDNQFVFSHNGQDFTHEQFASLCRFADSNKRTLTTTGFRGIGFKSTFSLGPEVRVFTPTLAVKFLEDRFTLPVWIDHCYAPPGITEIRVTLAPESDHVELLASLRQWADSPASLLFCRHVHELRIGPATLRRTRLDGPEIGRFEQWNLITSGLPQTARLLRSAKASFPQDAMDEIRKRRRSLEDGHEDDFDCSVEIVLGVRRGVYAILPTGEKTSLPFACNAPFVQKPDRVGIVSPASSRTNRWLLERIGSLAAEGMIAWLEHSDLEIVERCEAYSLLPPAPDTKNPLADPCLDAVDQGFLCTVGSHRILLSEDGELYPIGGCVSVPRKLLDVWPAEVLASIVGKDGQPILSRCLSNEHLKRLKQRNWVSVRSEKDVLQLLRNRPNLPRPTSLHSLWTLWTYVSGAVTQSNQIQNYLKLPIVPVTNQDTLVSSESVIRPADDRWDLSEEDFSVISSHVAMLDEEWLRYVTDCRVSAEKDSHLAAEVSQVEMVLFKIGLSQILPIGKVLERVVRGLIESSDSSIWLKLAHISAKRSLQAARGLLYETRSGQLRRADEVVADITGGVCNLTDPAWYAEHALHQDYWSTSPSCSSEEWRDWAQSGRSGLATFVPLVDRTYRPPKPEALEVYLAERGHRWKAPLESSTGHYKLEDWDFEEVHWSYWNSVAQSDEMIWYRLITGILDERLRNSILCRLVAKLSRYGDGKPKQIEDGIPAIWICRLRKVRCLPDSHGELRYPDELLRSTPSTELFAGTRPFVHPDLSNEEFWPLLKALGVKDEPPGPLELIPSLRVLTLNPKYDSGDVERIYRQLSSMTENSTEDDARRLCDVFSTEHLIRTENGTWARSCDVVLENDESHQDVLVVWQKVRRLELWRRLKVPERPSLEEGLAWLQNLVSDRPIDACNLGRVIRVLSRDPEQVSQRLGHWLNASDEWVRWDQLRFANWSRKGVPYHLFPNRMRQVANLGILLSEYRAKAPFSDLVPLEDAIEERAAESGVVRRDGERKGWLMALGSGLSRVKLKDAEETKRIRELGERLAVTQVVARAAVKVLPYLCGELAGEPRDSEVLWSGEVLYVKPRSPAQMAKAISEELGRYFKTSDIGDAIKYCYEREERFVNDYLNATFQLQSPTTLQNSSHPPANVGASGRHSTQGAGRGKGSLVSGSQGEQNATTGNRLPATGKSSPERRTHGETTGAVPGQAAPARSDSPAVSKPHTAGSSIARPGGSRSGSSGASVSTGTSPRSGYAVLRSYVVPDSKPGEFTESNDNTRRNELGHIGVERVLEFERRAGRFPEEMPPLNAGFDVRSSNAAGAVERYIEVKSLSGDWNGVDVAITRAQFEFALQRGPSVWLYVVERAAQDDFRVYPIQNPAQQANRFMFDYGWKDLAEPTSMGVTRRDDQHVPSTTGLKGDSGRVFQLADLLATVTDQTSVAICFGKEERFNGCNENGVAWFQFLQDSDPLPEKGAMVIVRHPELRCGATSVRIAAGRFFWTRQQDGDTGEQVVLVKLQTSGLPAKCLIRAEEWEAFRPLAVLHMTERG
jgi:hypothetical protein